MARRGVTQTVLGRAIGVSQAGVSKRLRGDVPFDINELAAAAALLEVTLETLTEGVAA